MLRGSVRALKHQCYSRWSKWDKATTLLVAIILSVIGLAVWWEFFDTNPAIRYNNLPFEGRGDLTPGGEVFVYVDQDKYTTASFTSSSDLVPCNEAIPVWNWQSAGPGGPKGHYEGPTPGVRIPNFIEPGLYFVQSRIKFQVNPLATRESTAYTSCFEIK